MSPEVAEALAEAAETKWPGVDLTEAELDAIRRVAAMYGLWDAAKPEARATPPCRCGATVNHPSIRDCAAALVDDSTAAPNGRAILAECLRLARMLCEKQRQYGDSATNPVRVFSKADATEQIRVRIDDKLSRLMRGSDAGEDTVGDLIGYLVLLRVVEGR